ncbi:MAG TPA: acyltransferase family protein, partial [Cellvibrio sp.]|nr:acyltransferase family protein [Cellvibrio sp.]
FATAAEWKPLLHTWSLAVEEQYYLFFPLLLMLTWKLGQRWLLALLIIIACASLAHAQWSTTNNPSAGFYLLPARGWELLIGAFVAFYLSNEQRRQFSPALNQVGSLAGLMLIGYAIFAFDKHTPFPSFYTLAPTLGAALVILFSTQNTLAGKLLSNPFFVGIGLISYSAYLWHWPLFVFARHQSIPEVPSQALLGSLALLALVLGYLSWRFIERPFRSKQKLTRQTIFTSSAVCMMFCIGFGLAGHYSKGFANRIANSSSIPAIDFPTMCFYQPDVAETLAPGEQGLKCWLGDTAGATKAILIGDSFAGNYEPFWDSVGKKTGLHINAVTTNYCVPSRTEDWTGPEYFKARVQCLLNRRFFADNIEHYDVTILAGNWMDYSSKNIMQGVLDTVDYAAARSKLVVLMAAPKAFDFNPVDLYNKSLMEKTVFDITTVPSLRDADEVVANQLLQDTAKKYPNVLYIDRDSLFNVDGAPSDVTQEKIPFSFDGHHISTYGSLSAATAFLQSQKYKDLITMLQVTKPILN